MLEPEIGISKKIIRWLTLIFLIIIIVIIIIHIALTIYGAFVNDVVNDEPINDEPINDAINYVYAVNVNKLKNELRSFKYTYFIKINNKIFHLMGFNKE